MTSFIKSALILLSALLLTWMAPVRAQTIPDGTAEHPLRVMLIPADGGTETGTRATINRSSTPSPE